MKKKKSIFESSKLTSSFTSLAVMGSITGLMLGGINKMFGTSEIPKGVVKELMEGVMDGLVFHFDGKIQDLKEENKKLGERCQELEESNERLKEENEGWKEQIGETIRRNKKPSKKKA